MSIELSRTAHYDGPNLPHGGLDIWHGHLDDDTEVYFTRPFEPGQTEPAAAMTVAKEVRQIDGISCQVSRYDFYPDDGVVSRKHRAMLAHAALYFIDADENSRIRGGADRVESIEGTNAFLQHKQINRSRYLPEPL